MKIRHVYTVIREFNVPAAKLAEEVEAFGAVLDETGEYLYGGGGPETITAKMFVAEKGRWIEKK